MIRIAYDKKIFAINFFPATADCLARLDYFQASINKKMTNKTIIPPRSRQ